MKTRILSLIIVANLATMVFGEIPTLYAYQDCEKSGTILTPVGGIINNHDYVDLGLSVMWATVNVGATSPEEYGNYYSWGEVDTKTDYRFSDSDNHYKWYYLYYSIYKMKGYFPYYISNGPPAVQNASGYSQDYRSKLLCTGDDPSNPTRCDDAANYHWGDKWRMPTYDEFKEFYQNTTREKVIINGIYCIRYTSTKSGYSDRSVILPAGGYYKDNNVAVSVNENLYYWTSELESTNSIDEINARAFRNIPTNVDWGSISDIFDGLLRPYGLPVRPVIKITQ